MKTDTMFVNNLEDTIRQRGAMDKLTSDKAQVEIRGIICAYMFGTCKSEPHQRHQNPPERKYQHFKSITNHMMERTGSPASICILIVAYVCYILKYTTRLILK